ncbi:glycosyltransferase [Candidatus Woesearchaeota archaeon]|nr:glycosyltransferase [Candidatus Woesearchaeota archaeon]
MILKRGGSVVKSNTESEFLFELSWEVCNKVGGIYTVVMSKAALMKKSFRNYFLVGPYFKEKSGLEFEEESLPKELEKPFRQLSKKGIKCHFGKWKVKGEPCTILIEFDSLKKEKDNIKKFFWDAYKIDSLNAGWDFEEPMLWSYAAALLLEKFMENEKTKASCQCHEWMSSFALLYLKAKKAGIGTVFTTHATMLGRAFAGNNYDLYESMGKINPQEEAYKLKIEAKFLTEKAAAKHCHVFTTVSETTAIEAEHFLGRKPDVLVLNGLDIKKFPTIEETSIKHITVREKIREFLSYYFFPYYTFDLSHNLIYFIVGRYEFRNKGIDIFIKALGKLNQRLKQEESARTVSAFFWIPASSSGIRTEMLENKNYYRHIKNFVDYKSDEIINKIVSSILSQKKLSATNIFDEEFREHMKKDIVHFRRKGSVPLSTHYMDEENDAMINALRKNNLNNAEEDKVKAIVYPVYLNGMDEMLNLNYYDAMAGCHLGVFPSYYEPWGYTPLEAAALGVASITTDLAGFGRFIQKKQKKKKNKGIFVLERAGLNEDENSAKLADMMYSYAKLSRNDRVLNKTIAKNLASLADWSILIKNYVEAHNLAVKKIEKG